MEQVIIGVDPHKLSATIEVVDAARAATRIRSLHHRSGRLRRDAASTPRRGRIGSGRSREPTVSVVHWRSGSSRPASTSSTCRPSSPPGSGSSTPATTARPMPCDAHSVAVVAVRTTNLRVLKVDGELEALRMLADRREALTRAGSRPCADSRPCWLNSFLARPNATSPPARPRRCSPLCGPATSPGRPVAGSRPKSSPS